MLKKLLRDQDGATMVEYALVLALVALVVITAVTMIGDHLNSFFNAAAGSV